jgi:aspartyl-tRNA(Asn)/glutamyl-tRNA(Gln) amidotransferase subunit C
MQMVVNEHLIDQLANLSRLEFSDTEKENMVGDMQQIIGFVEKLNELDTSAVEPLRYMSDSLNVYRPDIIGNMLAQDKALQSATLKTDTFFKVPKVIKKD